MDRNRKSKYDFKCFAYVQLQRNKDYNWINISGSFVNHSLNDKSLQVTEIRDLNNGKSNILKLYLE